jgi:hypothetical protein
MLTTAVSEKGAAWDEMILKKAFDLPAVSAAEADHVQSDVAIGAL